MIKEISKALLDFISKSPTSFHVVYNAKEMLLKEGFVELNRSTKWELVPDGKYFTTVNNSSLIAFKLGNDLSDYSFNIVAAHDDSPTFKIKPVPVLRGTKEYTKLSVQVYGGLIQSPWLDRPLSIAGRAIVKEEKDGKTHFITKLVNIDRDLCIIPNLAIHMNRELNQGYKYNPEIDLCPLFAQGDFTTEQFYQLIADNIGCDPKNLVSSELYLYPRYQGTFLGVNEEFVGSPRLDDQQCVFTGLRALITGYSSKAVDMMYIADNEEVGSSTKQGAGSSFLKDVMERINLALGKSEEDFKVALTKSMIVSADNAHSIHPNHPEKTDQANYVTMNKGVVIKHAARQSYTTDAISAAIFIECCNRAKVPYQNFAARADNPGGGTLGAISSRNVSIYSVDIGLAQLAMHSCYEVAGSQDNYFAIASMKEFYSQHLEIREDGDIESIHE